MNKTSVAQQAKTASFLSSAQGLLQRKCACGNHTMADGECEQCAKNKTVLQRKLAIGASNDPLEREADRVADQVLAASAHTFVGRASPHIQRYSGQATEAMDTAPASVDRVLASAGRPLEPMLRQDMEQRFGYDFSQVRVHTGDIAGQSARDVNANAYTAGHNIVFGAGRFAPGTLEGHRLIAHELTHVVQQSAADRNSVGLSPIPEDAKPSGVHRSFSNLLQRDEAAPAGERRVPVRIAVLGDCKAPEKIAEALPGARSMLRMAENWFIDYTYLVPHQQRWFDAILQAHFGSSSTAVRRTVHSRIIRMTRLIELANEAGVVFDCTAVSAEKCKNRPWSMFVTQGERNTIHVCPNFFTDGLEARRFTLVHESAHIAGVADQQYLVTAGPIGTAECLSPTPLSTDKALDNADSFTWAVWCLTREAGVTIIPGVEIKGQGQKP